MPPHHIIYNYTRQKHQLSFPFHFPSHRNFAKKKKKTQSGFPRKDGGAWRESGGTANGEGKREDSRSRFLVIVVFRFWQWGTGCPVVCEGEDLSFIWQRAAGSPGFRWWKAYEFFSFPFSLKLIYIFRLNC